ncbi:hypothetical protein OS493_002482 [Desmophyllum pertusum]|uniref:Uncharacterized protein n=1 Tax=Desmophyllum pertusum TaxID=174260 RepID=A0A9W9YT12_9CNID|nr:hypothetical protein OS493_002482 [Desmophyllum pertusum]
MDKFGVGDEFVHELSMAVEDFPIKSYLIKQCRSELNKQVQITTTPGLAPGAQHSFKELLADKVREMKNEATLKSGENIKVKLSGDGARMSRMTNFILMSFSILQQVDEVLASKGNHTIAVVNGSESRQSIEESFADVFREVNKVIDDGFIEVDGQRVGVEIFLGGDYKVSFPLIWP